MTNSVFYEHRMVGNEFNQIKQKASVIWCHNSIGAVAYVGRSVLLKVSQSKSTKKGSRVWCFRQKINPEYAGVTSWVFVPVTPERYRTPKASRMRGSVPDAPGNSQRAQESAKRAIASRILAHGQIFGNWSASRENPTGQRTGAPKGK
jgi:hypothetical protein